MEGGVSKKKPKKVKARKKKYQARLLKLKEEILAGTSGTTSGTTSDVYMYGVGCLAIVVVGLCTFYTFKGKEKV